MILTKYYLCLKNRVAPKELSVKWKALGMRWMTAVFRTSNSQGPSLLGATCVKVVTEFIFALTEPLQIQIGSTSSIIVESIMLSTPPLIIASWESPTQGLHPHLGNAAFILKLCGPNVTTAMVLWRQPRTRVASLTPRKVLLPIWVFAHLNYPAGVKRSLKKKPKKDLGKKEIAAHPRRAGPGWLTQCNNQ